MFTLKSPFQWVAALLMAASAMLSDVHARNLFHEVLGKSEEETTARIEATWRQFTQGDKATERLYFEAPDDTAYIADVGNGDVRSFVASLWNAPIPAGKWRYYNGLLHLLALLQVSGRFQPQFQQP